MKNQKEQVRNNQMSGKMFLHVLSFLLIMMCLTAVSNQKILAADYYTVTRTNNYLALRTEAAYSASNEIGKLYNGETVEYVSADKDGYWYVYSAKLRSYGYVNSKYLKKTETEVPVEDPGSSANTYKVTGTSNYLALRTEAAYDASNEIGKLYEGDTVTYVNSGEDGYWYVYSPTLRKYGYVNSNYLEKMKSPGKKRNQPVAVYEVYNTTNYLALRNDTEYDPANEIGKLYNGEMVEYINFGSDGYWYVYSISLGKYGYVNSAYLKRK